MAKFMQAQKLCSVKQYQQAYKGALRTLAQDMGYTAANAVPAHMRQALRAHAQSAARLKCYGEGRGSTNPIEWTPPRRGGGSRGSALAGPRKPVASGRFPHPKRTRAHFLAWYRDVLNTGDYPGVFAHTVDDLVWRAKSEIGTKRGGEVTWWKADGDAAQEAWENIGGQGKVSIAKLRALPQK